MKYIYIYMQKGGYQTGNFPDLRKEVSSLEGGNSDE